MINIYTPQQVYHPSGTTPSYFNTTDYIPYAVFYSLWL